MKIYRLVDGRFRVIPEYVESLFKEKNPEAVYLGSYYEPRFRVMRREHDRKAVLDYLDDSIQKTMKSLQDLTRARNKVEEYDPANIAKPEP